MKRQQIDKPATLNMKKLKDPVNKLCKTFYKGNDVHSNKKCFKCGDNIHRGHLKNSKAERKTCYECGKKGHLFDACKSKTDKRSPNRKFKKNDFQNM